MVFDDYWDLGGGVMTAVNDHIHATGELLYAGPIEQAIIVKGRKVRDNPEAGNWWRPEGTPKRIRMTDDPIRWPWGRTVDITLLANNPTYIRDLNSGHALPDFPGKNLANARRLAERILRICDYHERVLGETWRPE
jgi:hypothetical protein